MLFFPRFNTYYDPYDVVCASAHDEASVREDGESIVVPHLHIWLAGAIPTLHAPVRLVGQDAVAMRAALDARVARADALTLRFVDPTADLGTLARRAFEAYNDERGGLTWDGNPIPGWDAVGKGIQAAWKASVAATLRTVVDGLVR